MNAYAAEKNVDILKEYAEMSKVPFKLMLLFGSAAKGTVKPHSDIDIAVAADGPLSQDALLEIGAEISELLDTQVDVLDLFRTEGLILYKIMTTHIQIKKDERLLLKYYSKALGYREDFKPLQDMIRKARIKSFIHG